AEIEKSMPSVHSTFQEPPIQKHVRAGGVKLPQGTGARDLANTPTMEQQSGGNRGSAGSHHAQFRLSGKHPKETGKQAAAVHRRTQVAHVSAENRVELRKEVCTAPYYRQTVFFPFSDLVANLGRKPGPELLCSVRQF